MTSIEKHIVFRLSGRSIMLDLGKKNQPVVHLAEGIVHNGVIAWCNPNPPGMLIAGEGQAEIPKELDLEEGQEVTLIVKSYLNVVKIIPQALNNFVDKVKAGDKEAIQTIHESVI